MSYAATFALNLGPGNVSLALHAAIVGTDGNTVDHDLTGFVELGAGAYQWYYASFADGQRGSVVFYTGNYTGSNGSAWTNSGITVFPAASLDPELENTDEKTSAIDSLIETKIPASLVMTSGKLWVLDETGNPLPHAGAQMDLVDAPNATAIAAIQNGLAMPGNAMTLTSAYDAAKTAAQAGNQMDLVDAPNATAITAIQNGLATASALSTVSTQVSGVPNALLDQVDGVEIGTTMRQAIQYQSAILVGIVSGAGTNTEVFQGIGVGTTRVTVTADASGNRSAVALT